MQRFAGTFVATKNSLARERSALTHTSPPCGRPTRRGPGRSSPSKMRTLCRMCFCALLGTRAQDPHCLDGSRSHTRSVVNYCCSPTCYGQCAAFVTGCKERNCCASSTTNRPCVTHNAPCRGWTEAPLTADNILRTAVLSVSGQLRGYEEVIDNHLEMLVDANSRHYLIWVYLASDMKIPTEMVSRFRNHRGVQDVATLLTGGPKNCSGAHCNQLYKQRQLLDTLRAAPRRDIYCHTRFDANFTEPVHLREMDTVPPTLYVAFHSHLALTAVGNLSQQHVGEGIIFKQGAWSLRNHIPDYVFVGPWDLVSIVLGRYDHYKQVGQSFGNIFEPGRSIPERDRMSSIINTEEYFLQKVLALHGIEFHGTAHDKDKLLVPPSASVRLMRPSVRLVRRCRNGTSDWHKGCS